MEKIEEHKYWWLGENKQHFPEQEVLIRLAYPRVLVRYKPDEAFGVTLEEFFNGIADVQWIDGEKPSKEMRDIIFIEAWNFLAIEERLLENDLADIAIEEWEEDRWTSDNE